MNIKLLKYTLAMTSLLWAISANAAELERTTGLIYNNQANGPAIHSYDNRYPEKTVSAARLVYVNTAYGPALYSYPRNAQDTTAEINVEYVSNAYGPAIYSYPFNHRKPVTDYKLKLSGLNTPSNIQ
ncbi:MAG: hypothetical protein WC782_05295 [Methylococcaceae bacterium]|jgi:hypothetical protein